jgi:SAM-dependent methyltransferase
LHRRAEGVGVTNPFGLVYADQYDRLYRQKNYDAECDAIEELLRRYGVGATETILDLGCGTGSHATRLADRGYLLTGVDRSTAMLSHARAKAASRTGAGVPEFLEGDVRSIELGRTFDAVLMMFAVLGYQTKNDDVVAALRTVRQHIRHGGLFIFDVWFGPAVLAVRPSDRLAVIEDGGAQILRAASAQIDVMTHTCRVKYQVWRMVGDEVAARSEEEHTMRFFFPLELEHLLAEQGLEPCAVRPFDDLDGIPGLDTWNVWVCARAH